MTEDLKRSEALGAAINMEKEGMAFYRQAAEKMADPLAKKMFLSLVEDERRHAEIFQQMADQAGVRPTAVEELDKESPLQRVRTIFHDAAKQVREDLSPDDDQVKVIDIAKDMEQKAYDFYTATAKECDDPTEKDILGKIAAQENEHWRILDDTKLYLTNQAEWNIKEEKPVIDGG